jgi:flagellar basal-body rod protein FlgC
MFEVLDIGASGLLAQRARMDVIAGNVANMNTTRDASGALSPFRRRIAVLEPRPVGQRGSEGVRMARIELDESPFRRKWDPGHPDAGPDGYVLYPNIDLATEQVNMLEASRAYEANITLMETTKAMLNSTLRLLA